MTHPWIYPCGLGHVRSSRTEVIWWCGEREEIHFHQLLREQGGEKILVPKKEKVGRCCQERKKAARQGTRSRENWAGKPRTFLGGSGKPWALVSILGPCVVVLRMAHIWSQPGGLRKKEGPSDMTSTDTPAKVLRRRGYGKFMLRPP